MEKEPYNWFEENEDDDVGEFTPRETERNLSELIFDKLYDLSFYIFLISLTIFSARWFFDYDSLKIGKANFNAVLLFCIILFGSFVMISLITNITFVITKQFVSSITKRFIDLSNKGLRLSLWFTFNLYAIDYINSEFVLIYYDIIKNTLTCGLITFVSFTILSLIMEKFYQYFLKESLADKIIDIETRERILACMKNFRYEISEVSSIESSKSAGCLDIIFGNYEEHEGGLEQSHIDLFAKSEENDFGTLFLKKPEIYNIFDAKSLAKDVFEKASSDGVKLTFSDFSSIFPTAQIAFQAFSFFDTNEQKEVSKKEFRDTIISFFVERLNMEKNIKIAENFANILKNIVYIIASFFLFLAYLVIFGISVGDLLAFALSSALVLNFFVSGFAKELYCNIMFILSHPFDIGDDIVLESQDYKVFEIYLGSTSFICRNGGKITFLNSDLWQKKIVNMTRAPEKLMMFVFAIDPTLEIEKFRKLYEKISEFTIKNSFDYHHRFKIESISDQDNNIEKICCSLVLKLRGYKTRPKKFILRLEFSKQLRKIFEELKIELIK
ncbi:Small Conductance Mechanosensitive Ion Channel [Tubulinosema ratisbonensis]|uniref:Small Conductance Mechanosensitive Ion Channel n=1 Tax=Tubulinosema ratisbonensis TaxID=291195 RepID=A0A437AP30_9MICR|nr:Small Conductance Mechanosensitive Ion Channel [Tubulinosema ratisbonensis]